MSKSAIIILAMAWLICTVYLGIAHQYGLPYRGAAMTGAWVASALLLVCIIIFIRKNEGKKKA